MGRINIIICDGFGVGEAPDANKYGDVGSNTFKGVYNNSSLNIPNLKKMGLFNIDGLNMPEIEEEPIGCYGKCKPQCKGKNSPVGHWEIAGYIQPIPFKTYLDGFPEELLNRIVEEANIPGFICNKRGSGTELLKEYGEEMVRTKKPIVYTSVDSVFQIAAHEEVYSVKELYKICSIARQVIDEYDYYIGTVIARPYLGTCAEDFVRTYNRKDFEYTNYGKTMLDSFIENGKTVYAIGKIEDLFSGRGITRAIHTSGDADGIEHNIQALKKTNYDLIFTNLVDFDMLYGHRNNIEGYARDLEYLDSKLPEIIDLLREDDILIITADHGNDPSTPSTDHSREYIPLLVYGKNLKKNINLHTRETFADIAATILDIKGLPLLGTGDSFKELILD